jgi:hypothetical protein
MSNPTSLHKPYLVGTAFTGYELTITADNGVPTAGDGSVYNVRLAPLSGVRANVNRFGPKKVMIKGRFTGTAAATADCQVALWQWDADSEQWYATNCVTIAGTTVVSGSLTKGSMGQVDTDPNSRRGYLEVTGLAANQDIVLMVTKVE